MVNTEGPDGELHDYEIKYTFGIEPLQQYLIEFPGGRLQSLTTAWDTRPAAQGGQRWFNLYPDQHIGPDDPLHWTGRYQNWNGMCAECHSTHLQKNYDSASDSYQTRWSEINIGCQACHGPGAAHVNLATVSADSKLFYSGLPITFKADDANYEIDQCGRCHSRRRELRPDNQIGQPLLDNYMPSLLEPELYFPDGQIQDEVYVYGSFLQSRMYQAGVRCTDCHDPHTAGLKAAGNALCTQCHNPAQPSSGKARFAGLQSKLYDSPAHHFHATGTPGAQCVNCHMPARTYMVIDPRRDHSFRIPRPDLSDKLDTPNACTGCHEEQTPAWAAQQISRWYGAKQRPPHYGEVIAAARHGAPNSVSALIALAADSGQPALVRATALGLLPATTPDALRVLLTTTKAPDPLLRYGALRSLSQLNPRARFESIAPLLHDPLRAVRSEAGRALNGVPPAWFDDKQQLALDEALADYRAAQLAVTDIMPGAHLNLGVLQAERNDIDAAEKHYRAALVLDPGFAPARFNLATLYNATGRNDTAEQVLREGLERTPRTVNYSIRWGCCWPKTTPRTGGAGVEQAGCCRNACGFSTTTGWHCNILGSCKKPRQRLAKAPA
ncbi:MAG: cytochrome c3 family protein [Gammaproteobacteria bacterium]